MWWGYSPALDFREEIKRHVNFTDDPPGEVNVLLIGSCDARHILKTAAQTYRHPEAAFRVNFYVCEGSLELIARQLLLISVALEPSDVLGLLEKTRTFMELYGNLMVRPNTARYLSRKGTEWVDMITDQNHQRRRMESVNLADLKYKERDVLENIFKFWESYGGDIFNPPSHWDSRVRNHLAGRYDAKEGVFDWDYHMRLQPLGGERVNSREYKHWRRTGVAFTWPDSEFSAPNCNLASGVVQVGDKLCHHGYLGDIVNGPYVTFGLDCEDREMLRMTNGMNVKTSTDIAERNLTRLFHELQEQTPYKHREERSGGLVITEITEAELEKMNLEESSPAPTSGKTRAEYASISTPSVQIRFLPVSAVETLPKKQKFTRFFDTVFISQLSLQHFNGEVLKMVKDGALVLVESRLFVLGLRKDDLAEFGRTLLDTAASCRCVSTSEFDPLKDPVARFVVKSGDTK